MKYLVNICRVLVGVLFIISGLIKLNDPVGFSFKLEEYFSPAVLDLAFLMPYALVISLIVVILEVLLGVTLLLGYKRNLTVWSLLLMILFFTFLTFYSAYYNKVTDCGCFGDAVKLTPWESFTKDIILLVLILVLFKWRRNIKRIFRPYTTRLVVLGALLFCVFLAYYVLNHLPVLDFRPYKVNASIPEGMVVPDDAPKPIFEYAWKFDVDGEEQIIVTNGEYPNVDGEFIGVETEEIQKGYEPPIHDFTLEIAGVDYTEELMAEDKLLMVIAYDIAKTNSMAYPSIKQLTDDAIKKGYKVIGTSASNESRTGPFIAKFDLKFPFYFTDETTLKTIVRSNPGVLILKKGTILQKVHYNDLEDLNLE